MTFALLISEYAGSESIEKASRTPFSGVRARLILRVEFPDSLGNSAVCAGPPKLRPQSNGKWEIFRWPTQFKGLTIGIDFSLIISLLLDYESQILRLPSHQWR